jgi:branched-subunit amino acid ABC-type transport system permease component
MIALLVVVVVLLGIWLCCTKRNWDWQRAVAQDREVANLMGIKVKMCMGAFGLQ